MYMYDGFEGDGVELGTWN